MTGRVYGWKPDLPDHRDDQFLFRLTTPVIRPQVMDLSPFCSAVEDQGDIGSCTGNAFAGAIEYNEEMDPVTRISVMQVSRLFSYGLARMLERDYGQDNGAQIRDVIKQAAKIGYVDEKIWPYDPAHLTERIPPEVMHAASSHQITKYSRVLGREEMLQAIAQKSPVIFGITVYESFESEEVAKTGVVPMPHHKEQILGGHAVLAVGYDEKAKVIKVRNSWGRNWGQSGYFTLPYSYIVPQLADDMWVVYK